MRNYTSSLPFGTTETCSGKHGLLHQNIKLNSSKFRSNQAGVYFVKLSDEAPIEFTQRNFVLKIYPQDNYGGFKRELAVFEALKKSK